MEWISESLGLLAIFALAWTVLASPAIVGFVIVLRLMRRGRLVSRTAPWVLAAAFAVLAAPVPTPTMISIFIPHGLALLDATNYYRLILHGSAVMAQLLRWHIPSLLITFILSLALALHYGRQKQH